MPCLLVLLDHLRLVGSPGPRYTEVFLVGVSVVEEGLLRHFGQADCRPSHELFQLLLGCSAGGAEALDLGRRDEATHRLQAHGILV